MFADLCTSSTVWSLRKANFFSQKNPWPLSDSISSPYKILQKCWPNPLKKYFTTIKISLSILFPAGQNNMLCEKHVLNLSIYFPCKTFANHAIKGDEHILEY